jgi:hypothetical protein
MRNHPLVGAYCSPITTYLRFDGLGRSDANRNYALIYENLGKSVAKSIYQKSRVKESGVLGWAATNCRV